MSTSAVLISRLPVPGNESNNPVQLDHGGGPWSSIHTRLSIKLSVSDASAPFEDTVDNKLEVLNGDFTHNISGSNASARVPVPVPSSGFFKQTESVGPRPNLRPHLTNPEGNLSPLIPPRGKKVLGHRGGLRTRA